MMTDAPLPLSLSPELPTYRRTACRTWCLYLVLVAGAVFAVSPVRRANA